ncbi:hypothetical protein A3Q56_02260 [Intoshia linei]|uniref:Coronin n=1 Tax=Intoshia linei TaxID=1819745 RepID=A0A177B6R9_9BILA|nr:hypothetical protein A3Q56_02260 [Intoshia linei]
MFKTSKFRNVFGKPFHRNDTYDSISPSSFSGDSFLLAVNPKYLSIIVDRANGSSIQILPLQKYGRVDRYFNLLSKHAGPVYDIQFNPYNDDLLASSSDDCSIALWIIPDNGVSIAKDIEPATRLLGHQRKVTKLAWHPTVSNILASSGSDNTIFVWNCETQRPISSITLPESAFCISWSSNGQYIAATCRDTNIYIIDPRKGEIIRSGKGHTSAKYSSCVFTKNDLIFTTGCNKRGGSREVGLYNINLDLLQREDFDRSTGSLLAYHDKELDIIYVIGKGDSSFRYYQISADEKESFTYLNIYQSTEAQKGFAVLTKRGCDTKKCEIARVYKLNNSNKIEPISMIVPRKGTDYQSDIYPPIIGTEPALSVSEWLSGKNTHPIRVDQLTFSTSSGTDNNQSSFNFTSALNSNAKRNISVTTGVFDGSSNNSKPSSIKSENNEEVLQHKKKVLALEAIVRGHETRILELENTIKRLTSDLYENENESDA